MTISPTQSDHGGEGTSNRLSYKRQRVPSFLDETTVSSRRDGSSSGKEDEVECLPNDPSEGRERVLVVLSDDSDSEEETLGHFLRSVRRQKLSPSSKPLTLPNSDLLDCPTCLEPLKRPIFQCNNGHLACSSCCAKLKKKCTFCALPIGDIRCRSMEKVLKACLVSCSNGKYGCKQSTTYGKEETNHKELCVFAPCSCPVRNCNYIGYYKDLNNHFRATHKQSPGEIMSFAFKSPVIFGLDHNDDPVIFQERKEGDLIVVRSVKGSNGVYVSVSRIAPMAKEICKLSCSVAHLKEFSTLRLGFIVKHVQKVREQQEQPEDSFMLIPSHMLSSDHLKMQICIGDRYEYTHI